ncbi:jg15441 [Pararge aegeria aegeria]|uniref:Jg15441 protein n=1 Tax=Pararge aegeria aegeria TaxID=348720 RepID=A0A8S4S5P0_9NEOP|nr:jg15441 [Pararge aegeria aegeria]
MVFQLPSREPSKWHVDSPSSLVPRLRGSTNSILKKITGRLDCSLVDYEPITLLEENRGPVIGDEDDEDNTEMESGHVTITPQRFCCNQLHVEAIFTSYFKVT